MFALILTVLNRECNRGYQMSLVRTVNIRGNIPRLKVFGVRDVPCDAMRF